MTKSDKVALILSLLAVFVTALVADRVYERMPHLEDEMAYVWQAQAIAGGRLTVPSPPSPKSFLVPFVVDYHGQRFGKYPLGWPVVLSLGVLLGIRFMVNPLLAGVGLWLTYKLGKKVYNETVGLIAAGLTLTSPFFLVISGSLLSHPMGLVLSGAFALCWLEAFTHSSKIPSWFAVGASALSLGLLILTRPLSAVAIAIPFAVHGMVLLVQGNRIIRLRLVGFVAIVLAMASMHFAWQYAVTGDALLNPYTLWWSYDKVGFGPGFGRIAGGHNLHQAWINTRDSLWVGYGDLFGWGNYSWIFLPVGIFAYWRNWRGILVSLVFPSLVIVYLAYWIGSSLFGPRYFYEGLYSLTLTSAAGIAWLAGWSIEPDGKILIGTGWQRVRTPIVILLMIALVVVNLTTYLPSRLKSMYGLYGIQRSHLASFQTEDAKKLTPALVFVHLSGKWTQYGTLLELQDPFLDTPFILAISRGVEIDQSISSHFTDRKVLHYYPEDPTHFYPVPIE